jgi:hypothetical protein
MVSSKALTILLPTAGIVVAGIALFVWAAQQVPSAAFRPIPIEKRMAPAVAANNVFQEGTTQVIEITAKGGYFPEVSEAKAGVPTILRLKTSNTFDCSVTLNIPAMRYQARLPFNGTTDIQLPAQAPGTTFTALCGMGMYSFDITFSA